MAVNIESSVFLDPAGVGMLCPPIDRERDGADERDARHGSSDTCNLISLQRPYVEDMILHPEGTMRQDKNRFATNSPRKNPARASVR